MRSCPGHTAMKRRTISGVRVGSGTQGADGVWITASELVSTEPDEAKDYIYDYWGTTWATIGLSRALDVLGE